MSFRWVITQLEQKEAVSNLMEILNVPEAIARLLAIRGISSFEDAKQFFTLKISSSSVFIFKYVSCCPAKEAFGRSSAMAEDLTATCISSQ